MLDTFTDIHVMVSLQYKEQIQIYREHLSRFPEDSDTRLLLGKEYIKLGLYLEGSRELVEAARNPALRSEALSESAVANYRVGNFNRAIEDGVAALEAFPGDDRTRYWVWLAAQRLGGYPDCVPENARIEVKAGRSSALHVALSEDGLQPVRVAQANQSPKPKWYSSPPSTLGRAEARPH
jgi:tetratricopeptide (TPR) repeat protein